MGDGIVPEGGVLTALSEATVRDSARAIAPKMTSAAAARGVPISGLHHPGLEIDIGVTLTRAGFLMHTVPGERLTPWALGTQPSIT